MKNTKKFWAVLAIVLVISMIPCLGLIGNAVAWVAEVTPVDVFAYYDVYTSSGYVYDTTSNYTYGGSVWDYVYGTTDGYVYNSVENSVYDKAPRFNDVTPDAWYYKAVEEVASSGFFKGNQDGNFSPDDEMTRAMLVTVLYRMKGSPYTSYQVNFKDVEKGSWYETAVAWANENGIVGGYNETTFGTNDKVTRQDLVTILARYAKVNNRFSEGFPFDALSRFKDAGSIADYSKDAFAWAFALGYINGTDETHISPKATATRAQVATILARYMYLI